MKVPGVATTKYPSTSLNNPGQVFASLGTFWTRVFSDREALRGLSIAQSEELIQRYYELVDSIACLSAKQMPELKRERWLPIRVKKSSVRLAPLVFLPNGDQDTAFFGEQPLPVSDTTTDTRNCRLHYGEVFQFGKVKRPVEKVYVVTLPTEVKVLPTIVNRVIGPTSTLINGIDYRLINNTLYLNVNPFELPNVNKYKLFDSSGKQVRYSYKNPYYNYGPTIENETSLGLADGTLVDEEEVLLWGYNAEIDADSLYTSFGYIFDFKEQDPTIYKQVLQAMVNLLVEGPTISAIGAVASAFVGIKTVQEEGEVVRDAYEVSGDLFVVTDKQVYTAPSSTYTFSSNVYNTNPLINKVLHLGESVFDSVEYYDQLTYKSWWKKTGLLDGGSNNTFALPPFMFVGNYNGVLVVENNDSNVAPYTLSSTLIPKHAGLKFAGPTDFSGEPTYSALTGWTYELYLSSAALIAAHSSGTTIVLKGIKDYVTGSSIFTLLSGEVFQGAYTFDGETTSIRYTANGSVNTAPASGTFAKLTFSTRTKITELQWESITEVSGGGTLADSGVVDFGNKLNERYYNISFPFSSQTSASDQATYNQYLYDRQETTVPLLKAYANANGGRMNPADFFFTYFLQTNAALYKIKFTTVSQAARFTKLFKIMRPCLPSHVYLVFHFAFPLTQETLNVLHNASTETSIGSDGSNSLGTITQPLPPWELPFGIAESTSDNISQFVLARGIDLFHNNTADVIDVPATYLVGTDSNRSPLTAFKRQGQLTITDNSASVVGVGTNFFRDVLVGDLIYDYGSNLAVKEHRTITSIESETELTLDTPFSFTAGSPRNITFWLAKGTPSMQNTRGLVMLST